MALSYVWGGASSSETTRDNIEELQKPGSLDRKEVIVPKTIRHAIGLVRQLGERYLWVDRFCICQDDVESKHDQISVMGDIYANAYVTIIAANGWDADHGLRGIKNVTEPRQISPNFDHDYMESLQPYSTIWYDRGWTFQELFFSKRKIFFQYQVAVWECCCDLWHEATGLSGTMPISNQGGRLGLPREFSKVKSMSPWGFSDVPVAPDLRSYFRMVKHYNLRKLTYPEDGYRAFSGVISALESAFPGGFIWGLPVMYFETALLWIPLQESKRRVAKESLELLPSWSWVGWEGPVTSIRGDPERSGRYPPPPVFDETRSDCQWQWPCEKPHNILESVGEQTEHTINKSTLLQIDTQTTALPLEHFFYWLDGENTSFSNTGTPFVQPFMQSPMITTERFELMLISRSSGAVSGYDFGESDDTSSLERPVAYNCLIFRREGELTYRVGVAMIPESHWKAASKKQETLYLA